MSSSQRDYEFSYRSPAFRYLLLSLKAICVLCISACLVALIYLDLEESFEMIVIGALMLVGAFYLNLYRIDQSIVELLQRPRETRGLALIAIATVFLSYGIAIFAGMI